jgi:transcriptional regulator of acetoin/glycerol metabolism
LSRRALDKLCGHGWPGNVRELENVLDRAALLAGDRGVIDDVRFSGPEVAEPRRLTVTRQEFLAAWTHADGVASEVASTLGVTKRSVFRLKAKYLDA